MTNDILFKEIPDANNKKLAQVILNRPKALNAISHNMFIALDEQLRKWEEDDAIKAVLVKSSSEKAFSAGGDIRAIYESKGAPAEVISKYFELEYGVNQLIYHYSKPYISFLNGITMGGGVGISLHGSHPIGTENLKFAMPETLIGFFPDIGASYYFSRMQDCAGIYLGLTGKTIDVNDAYALDLVEHHVPSSKLEALEKALIDASFDSNEKQKVSAIIRDFEQPVSASQIEAHQSEIKHHFRFDSVEEIIASLKSDDQWGAEVAADLMKRSPTSLKVTLEQFKRASTMDFDAVIKMDLHIAKQFLKGHDFFEGIRAAVVDKDRNPRWRPVELSGVTDESLLSYFEN